MPPPNLVVAVLSEMVELAMLRVPVFQMPPPNPVVAVLPEMVELAMLRVPELLKPPPLLEVLLAPETVTPEMLRLPKLTIEKILKLPLLPLMLSVFAPGPVMVRVPAVATSAMAGSVPVRDIVAGPLVNSEEAKTIVSAPVVALAKSIASLKEVKASVADVSCRVFTVIGVGLILSSR